jgi:hypothetical protein
MEPDGLLRCSQEPATGPYPQPDDPVHILSHPISPRFILILSSHLGLGLTSGLPRSGFLTKRLCAVLISPLRATCRPVSSFFILSS